jgi:hypothetical protein
LLLQTYLAAALMYHGRPIASVRRIANIVVVAALSLVITGDLMAQVQSFGASDDPRESIQSVWWRHDQQLDVMAGPSLISRQWRAKGSVSLNMESPLLLARFTSQLRAGVYGLYEPDVSTWYDVIRAIEFIRLNTTATSPVHARVGVINHMRLGEGHLVDFYNSGVAWDERTVGMEAMLETRLADVMAFSDNVLFDGVVGGRVAARPFFLASDVRTRSLEAGFSAVTDLGTLRSDRTSLIGYNVDLSFIALGSEALHLAPWASFAWYDQYGSGLGVGASVRSDNFIDVARFHLRTGLFYNGNRFMPGYVGSFYGVNNDRARIADSRHYLEGERNIVPEGLTLAEARGGNDLVTDFRMMVFDRFEFWYNFKRHYGSSDLSEVHLRLFVHVPEQVRVNVGIDRGSLGGFWSIFRTIGDRAALVFGTEYGVTDLVWLHINARYTYELAEKGEDGTDYFLVQRRFEPMVGARLRF